jgi:LAGLIDADG endonuclease
VTGDNATSGDNQQETSKSRLELDAHWVVGFVDGEGCFSVSIHRNPFVRRTPGFQVNPVFQVSQHRSHRAVLEGLVSFFGCGRVRSKGRNSTVEVFAVDRMVDLEHHVIPFFEHYPLIVKAQDFAAFARIVRMMRQKEHLTTEGYEQIVRLAYATNANGKQRARSIDEVLEGSSETARQARLLQEPVKIQSDLHGDMQSQAEMTWPTESAASRFGE